MARAAALHAYPLREVIHSLKYENRPELAECLARYLTAVFAYEPWPALAKTINGVTPVPLHEQRLTERGYNQSELLAIAFCRSIQLALRPHWLRRIRMTRQQVGLNMQERQENVAEAFAAAPDVAGQSILLIDDVYTTGATLRACANAAMEAGASAVYGLTLAIPAGGHALSDGSV
jgi:ComF family protein